MRLNISLLYSLKKDMLDKSIYQFG